MAQTLRILLIEDSPADAKLICWEIRKYGIEFTELIVETKDEYIRALKDFEPDLILSDYLLTDFDGKEALALQQEFAPFIPFILVTGSVNEETAVECMKSGADDYIIKQNLKRLGEAIKGVLEKKKLQKEKREFEEMLVQSEERYRSLFENSAIPIFEEDLSLLKKFFDELKAGGVKDFRAHFNNHPEDVVRCSSLIQIKDINKESIRFFNAEERTHITEDIMLGFLDETWPFFKEELIALAEGKTYFECEMPVSTYNWDHKDVIIKLSVRPDSIHTLEHVLVSFVDITARKQAEAALAESEELFRVASENAIIGVCMMNTEGDLMFVNDAVCDLLGFTKEEMIKMNFRDIVHHDELEVGLSLFRDMTEGKIQHSNYDQRYLNNDGSVIWTSVSTGIIHSTIRRKDYFVSYIQDITKRKEAEEAIRRNAELYCTLTENMKDVVWIIDPDTLLFTYVSPSAVKMVGFTVEEIMSRSMTAIVPPEFGEKLTHDMRKIIDDCASGIEKPGTYHTQVIKQPCKDGSIILAEITAYAYQNIDTGKLELHGVHRDVTARYKAEEKLRKSEEKFRLLFEHAADPIQLLDENLHFIDCNMATLQILNAPSKEVFLSSFPSDISPEQQPDGRSSLERSKELVRKAFEQGNHQFEWVHKRFDNTLFTVDINLTKIVMEDRNLLLVHWRDITERKAMEEALLKSEEKFRLLAENVSDVIWTMDMDGKNTYVSPSIEKLRGFTPEEVLIQTDKESLTPASREIASKFLDEARMLILQGKKFESYNLTLEQPCKDKSTVWVEVTITGIYDNTGSFVSFLGVSRNISDRLKAEEELRESQEKYRLLIENQGEGAAIVNLREEFVFANPAAEKMFEVPAGTLVGRCLTEFLLNDQIEKIRKESVKRLTGRSSTYELEIITAKGEIRHLLVTVSPQYTSEKKLSGTFGIFRDITDRKKAEVALLAAKEKAEENDRMKTAFLNNISHEIRTPMNAIIGFSGFLNEPNLIEEKRKHFTEIICNASNQLLSIITDIINISTIEAGQETIRKTRMNVNELMKNLYNQFEIKVTNLPLKMSCICPLPDHLAFIETDETKMIQVISNLIGNALKFTKQGFIEFGYTVKNDFLEFYVKDSGIGIPANMHHEIFERFRQADSTIARQYGGTGLGLSISKAYIQLMGGTIWLSSVPGAGTTFYFTLPYENLIHDDHPANEMIDHTQLKFEGSKTVLVAEDEDFNYLLLEQVLSGLELHLIRARNGAEAVMQCKSDPSIELVLMDIKMPVMDGYEATRMIKQFRPELPIIMQSAYVRESDKLKAAECGCDAYISKPIDINEFIELLKSYFSEERQIVVSNIPKTAC